MSKDKEKINEVIKEEEEVVLSIVGYDEEDMDFLMEESEVKDD